MKNINLNTNNNYGKAKKYFDEKPKIMNKRNEILDLFEELLNVSGKFSLKHTCPAKKIKLNTYYKKRNNFEYICKILNDAFNIKIGKNSNVKELDNAINKIKEITKTESKLLFEILRNTDDSQLLNAYINFLSVHSDDYLLDNKSIEDIGIFLKMKRKIISDLNDAYWKKFMEICNESFSSIIELKTYYIDDKPNNALTVFLDFPPTIAKNCALETISFDVDKTYAPKEDIYIFLQDETACRLCFILQEHLCDIEFLIEISDIEEEKILYKKAAERLSQLIEIVANDYCIDYGDFEEYDVSSINTILLYGLLAEDDRYDDIKRAKKDISFAKSLAEEYDILNNILE